MFCNFLCSVYTYESHSNELWVVMRTDETVSMSGYSALWEALKVDQCENKTYRGLNSGFIQSPGFPNEESSRFSLPLDCWTIIDAPSKCRFLKGLRFAFKGCQKGQDKLASRGIFDRECIQKVPQV